MTETGPTFDRGAAITRSLLGWGVVAGPFYLVIGLVLGSTRPGFDFTRDALSMLMLGDLGWIQRVNFVLCGVMVIAAGVGVLRAIRSGRGLAIGAPVIVAGTALILGAAFGPDPANGSPTATGMLHLFCGAIQFVAIAGAALAYARWSRTVGNPRRGTVSVVLAVGILGAFAGGVALAQHTGGIALLWIAVVCEWIWLAMASAWAYQWSPHPLGAAER